MDSTWDRKNRQEKLAWFATLDDKTLDRIWRTSVDAVMPVSFRKDVFVCLSCHSWIPGLECLERKNYKDCEVVRDLSVVATEGERE